VLAPAFRLRYKAPDYDRLYKARLVERFLAMLTRTGKAFPIPYRVSGMDALLDATGSGSIEVTFSKPPDLFCSTEETIQANLLTLERETKRILGGSRAYSCSIIVTGSSASQKKIPAK